MSKPPAEPAKTVVYSDHELITPDHRPLRQALVRAMPGDEDPIARAEQALGKLSRDFGKWMADDCQRLNAAREDVKTSGFNTQNRETLFHISDNIKGNAATLGFAEASPVADSLCRLLEHTPDPARIPLQLVDQHVDAIRAIVREHDRADIGIMASVLATRLRQVTEEFLVYENRHRPEYLAAIESPMLAPSPPSAGERP
ncbi:MAG TPA: Hpt domain-containing protein [Xanthobacteraceae bacterium]|nr:Hpt domain-containing protein [Xanthobacteraceae bacterium]